MEENIVHMICTVTYCIKLKPMNILFLCHFWISDWYWWWLSEYWSASLFFLPFLSLLFQYEIICTNVQLTILDWILVYVCYFYFVCAYFLQSNSVKISSRFEFILSPSLSGNISFTFVDWSFLWVNLLFLLFHLPNCFIRESGRKNDLPIQRFIFLSKKILSLIVRKIKCNVLIIWLVFLFFCVCVSVWIE